MSDDVLTPTKNTTINSESFNQELLLSLPVERLRSSLRYLYSKDKKYLKINLMLILSNYLFAI